jgi:hypothetical protein
MRTETGGGKRCGCGAKERCSGASHNMYCVAREARRIMGSTLGAAQNSRPEAEVPNDRNLADWGAAQTADSSVAYRGFEARRRMSGSGINGTRQSHQWNQVC